jgi:hypothetical protein
MSDDNEQQRAGHTDISTCKIASPPPPNTKFGPGTYAEIRFSYVKSGYI